MYEYKCTIDRIIDGDTVVLDVDLGFGMTKNVHTRLLDVYAPKNNTPEGKAASSELQHMFNEFGPYFIVRFIKRRSFYRYVGTLWTTVSETKLENINDKMNEWFDDQRIKGNSDFKDVN